mgnify:FL=1
MQQSSQLEDLLRAEAGEGMMESSGSFTISGKKALEKLAAFRLPRETAWVLKIVQAAVASGCSQLDIRQTRSATEFHFHGETGWSLAQVEAEFYRVESRSTPSLEHLRQGLWSACLRGMRPFTLTEPNLAEALFWTGKQLRRKPVRSQTHTTLTISHRSITDGRRFSLIPDAQGASRNAEVARELSAHAYTCCIPLRLDSRRLDNLLASPAHGLSSSTYPIEIGFLPAEVPPYGLPPGTLKGLPAGQGVDSSLKKLLRPPANPPSQTGLACLITAHVRRVGQGKVTVWQTYHERSLVFWVRDGVVVESTALKSATCCSLALFASAAELGADATGFGVVKNSDYYVRLKKLKESASSFLSQVELDPGSTIKEAHLKARRIGGAVMVGGLGLSLASLPHGLLLVAGGALNLAMAGRKEKEIVEQIRTGLGTLKQEWQCR